MFTVSEGLWYENFGEAIILPKSAMLHYGSWSKSFSYGKGEGDP